MGLADSLKSEVDNSRRGPICSIGVILSRLSPEEADLLRGYMADTSIGSTTISRALGREGHRVSPPTVGRHRKGTCSCEV